MEQATTSTDFSMMMCRVYSGVGWRVQGGETRTNMLKIGSHIFVVNYMG